MVAISLFAVGLFANLVTNFIYHQFRSQVTSYPDSKKLMKLMGPFASPIRGEPGYAHWPQLGNPIYCPIGHQIWGPLGKQDVWPNFALTAAKFLFSNSGNFRAKANPPKPRSCPKRPFGQWMGQNSSADWEVTNRGPNLRRQSLGVNRSWNLCF